MMAKTSKKKMSPQCHKGVTTEPKTEVKAKLFKRQELLCKTTTSSQVLHSLRRVRLALESEWENLEGKRRRLQLVETKRESKRLLSPKNWVVSADPPTTLMEASEVVASKRKTLSL